MKYISIAVIFTALTISNCSQNQQSKASISEPPKTPEFTVYEMSRDFTENFNEAKDKYMNKHVILKGFVHEKFKTADDHYVVVIRGYKVDSNIIHVMDGLNDLYLSDVECMLSSDTLYNQILDRFYSKDNFVEINSKNKAKKHIKSQIVSIEGDIKDITKQAPYFYSKFPISFTMKLRKCKIVSFENTKLDIYEDLEELKTRIQFFGQ